jgi:hypothetical protein
MPTATEPRRVPRYSEPERAWISAGAAAKILDRPVTSIRKLADQGQVRTHQPPGLMRLYFRADVERFAPPVLSNA